MAHEDNVVYVYTSEPVSPDGRPMVTRSTEAMGARSVAVSLSELRKSMASFLAATDAMLVATENKDSAFSMTEVVVQAQIGADGKVGFLGSGVSANAQASLTITFARNGG